MIYIDLCQLFANLGCILLSATLFLPHQCWQNVVLPWFALVSRIETRWLRQNDDFVFYTSNCEVWALCSQFLAFSLDEFAHNFQIVFYIIELEEHNNKNLHIWSEHVDFFNFDYSGRFHWNDWTFVSTAHVLSPVTCFMTVLMNVDSI